MMRDNVRLLVGIGLVVGLMGVQPGAAADRPARSTPDRSADQVGQPSAGDYSTLSLPFGELAVPAGTLVDSDEFASRAYQSATVTLLGGESWEMSWTWGDWRLAYDEMDLKGIEPEPGLDGFSARANRQDVDTCVFATGAHGATLFFSRIAGDGERCPLVEDLMPFMPRVASADIQQSAPAADAWGTYEGSFNGVSAYSNGTTSTVCCASTYGYQYQCVEYVVRYYVKALGWKNMNGSGNANQYCTNTSKTGLKVYSNGGTTKPAVNDILVSKGTSSNVGHVAIVREVGTNYVKVIQQNWCNCSSDNSKQLTMTVSSGKYTVSQFGSSYPVSCWARK